MKRKIKALLKKEKGFTLVELLAVIVILGIIAAIAVPSIGEFIEKSRYDGAKAEALQALSAAKMYVAAEGEPSADMTQDTLKEYLETPTNWTSFTIKYDKTAKSFTFSGVAAGDTNPKFDNTTNYRDSGCYFWTGW